MLQMYIITSNMQRAATIIASIVDTVRQVLQQ